MQYGVHALFACIMRLYVLCACIACIYCVPACNVVHREPGVCYALQLKELLLDT